MNYAKNDMDASRAARDGMDKSGVRWFKPDMGTNPTGWHSNYVRPLPPHVNMVDPQSGAHRFYHPICLHFQVGPSKKVVPCPRRMQDKYCPQCETAFALKNAGQEQTGNDMLPSWQAYMSVIVYTEVHGPGTAANPAGPVIGLEPVRNKAGEIEVKVWSASRGVLDQIFDAIEERQAEQGGFIDIADVENGYILKLSRKGKDKTDTKYKVTLDREPTSIADLVDEWDEQLVDLSTLSPLVDSEAIKTLMVGGGGSDPFERPTATNRTLPVRASVVESRFAEEPEEGTVEGEFREVAEPEEEISPAQRLKAQMAKKGTK